MLHLVLLVTVLLKRIMRSVEAHCTNLPSCLHPSINVFFNLASENIPWNLLFDGKWLFWQKSLCKIWNTYFSLHILDKGRREKKVIQYFWNCQQTRIFAISFQWNISIFLRKNRFTDLTFFFFFWLKTKLHRQKHSD